MLDVSIVIVCMNNLKYLYPCLDSIKAHTKCNYEVLVTAYLFNQENLNRLKQDYPWVRVVESNEIRGFAENNNLALRLAKGRYCFALNDDTLMTSPIVDELLETFKKVPEHAAIVSPVTLNADGTVQRCGKPKYTLFTKLMALAMLSRFVKKKKSPYVNQKGLFRSYNISGAAFMIPTELFEKVGWFDERYFFCPEDIALSTKLNEMGYSCWVQNSARITHYGGGTWSKTIAATKPASTKGDIIFYGRGNPLRIFLYVFFATFNHSLKVLYWFFRFGCPEKGKRETMMAANWHAIVALYSRKTPKELFTKYYKRLRKQ